MNLAGDFGAFFFPDLQQTGGQLLQLLPRLFEGRVERTGIRIGPSASLQHFIELMRDQSDLQGAFHRRPDVKIPERDRPRGLSQGVHRPLDRPVVVERQGGQDERRDEHGEHGRRSASRCRISRRDGANAFEPIPIDHGRQQRVDLLGCPLLPRRHERHLGGRRRFAPSGRFALQAAVARPQRDQFGKTTAVVTLRDGGVVSFQVPLDIGGLPGERHAPRLRCPPAHGFEHAVLVEILGHAGDGRRARHWIEGHMADHGVESEEVDQGEDAEDCDEGESDPKANEQFANRPDAWNVRHYLDSSARAS